MLLASPARLQADVLIADLRVAPGAPHTSSVRPGTHTVERRNVVPATEHRLTVEVLPIPVETLQWPRAEIESLRASRSPCPEITTLVQELDAAVDGKDEAKIQAATHRLHSSV